MVKSFVLLALLALALAEPEVQKDPSVLPLDIDDYEMDRKVIDKETL